MTQLTTKIKLYTNKEVDFRTDVLLQDDGNGAYIKEWNLDIAKPTMAQLDAFEAQATTYENNEKLKQLENLYMVLGTSSLKKFTIMV
jgi:hypothetical protein